MSCIELLLPSGEKLAARRPRAGTKPSEEAGARGVDGRGGAADLLGGSCGWVEGADAWTDAAKELRRARGGRRRSV